MTTSQRMTLADWAETAGGSKPAPTFHAQGAISTNSSGTGSTSNTGNLPTRSTNDILLMFLTVDTGAATFTISGAGWVAIDYLSTGGCTAGLFWRLVDGTETAPTISFGGSTNSSYISSYSGCKTSAPIGASNGAGNSVNPLTVASLTTTAANSLIVFMAGHVTAEVIPTPTRYTLEGTAYSATAPSLIIAHETVAASGGSSTAVSENMTTSNYWASKVLELKAN